jgi:hypothetical protein
MADARARRIVEITSGGHKALNYDPHWITLRVRNGLPEHIFEKNPPVGIYPYIPQVISRPGSCNRGTTSIAAARTSAPAPAFPSTMLPGQHPASPGIISRGTPGASRGRSWGGSLMNTAARSWRRCWHGSRHPSFRQAARRTPVHMGSPGGRARPRGTPAESASVRSAAFGLALATLDH